MKVVLPRKGNKCKYFILSSIESINNNRLNNEGCFTKTRKQKEFLISKIKFLK